MFTNFHHIWRIAVNAEQCAFKTYTSTHYLTRDKKCDKIQ